MQSAQVCEEIDHLSVWIRSLVNCMANSLSAMERTWGCGAWKVLRKQRWCYLVYITENINVLMLIGSPVCRCQGTNLLSWLCFREVLRGEESVLGMLYIRWRKELITQLFGLKPTLQCHFLIKYLQTNDFGCVVCLSYEVMGRMKLWRYSW